MVHVQLRDICGVRSGDKGDISDLTLFADTSEHYDLLVQEITPEAVKAHFGAIVKGDVQRYEVPNVLGLHFVLHQALGGGGPASIRSDNLGKTLGGALLRMSIDMPPELLASAPRYGRRAPLDELDGIGVRE